MGQSSPFQQEGIWIDSLLIQLQNTILQNGNSAKGIEKILLSLGVPEHKIGKVKFDSIIRDDKYDTALATEIQKQIDNCTCGATH